ncbi:vasoactive intestinal polypeptide receptor 1 [Columba guinea]|nr:vasoactive intestinal polypeptide receptor 1 [Columba guinea]
MGGLRQPPGACTMLVLLLTLLMLRVRATHPDCSIVLYFQDQEAECLEIIRTESQRPAPPGQQGCPTEWDGVSCWLAVPVGQSRAVTCPDILHVFKKSKVLIRRNCTESGWSFPSPLYGNACELEAIGSSNDTEDKARGSPGGERLFCHHEGALHLRLLHIPGSPDPGHRHLLLLQVNCKAAIAFFQYSVLANFYWLLVEGVYLQTLLLLTFTSDKRYIWWYILIGWGVPMLTVCVWVVTRLQYDNHGCWDDYTSLYWWVIKAPILLAIFVNFFIFLNVTRMLAQKIRSPDISKNYKQQYMEAEEAKSGEAKSPLPPVENHLPDQEVLEDAPVDVHIEDKVNVNSEGSIPPTPQIHSNPEKMKEAKVNGE